jgi:hypothetical protein
MIFRFLFSPLLLILVTLHGYATQQTPDRFDEIVKHLEGTLFDFGREVVERHGSKRCDLDSLKQCVGNNYDACVSTHTSQTCPQTPSFGGMGTSVWCDCGFLFDFERSVNMIPSDLTTGDDNNPTDPGVIESICYTQDLDDFFIKTREENQAFWSEFGIEPTSMYFGSETRHFRQYPAQYERNCGNFDPTVRPWFVAASSGPKNVALVLDTSKSMVGKPLELLKEAAKRIIQTLTVADRVIIVTFGDYAEVIGNSTNLYEASYENIQVLLDYIDNIEANGVTNMYDAFETTFRVLKESKKAGSTVNCSSAILFFTDGELNIPSQPNIDNQAVLDLVATGLNETSTGHPTVLMTYSIGDSSAVTHNLPSLLACSHDYGVHSKIEDINDIVGSLSSYYKFFSFGLRGGVNENFVAWVEPYEFKQSELIGTTVSLPLYSSDDGRFIGVVGIDLLIEAFNVAIGGSSEESIRRIVEYSTAKCPRLELTVCDIESYRLQSSGSTCTSICGEDELVDLDELRCFNSSVYPTNIWTDSNNKETPYQELACCPCTTEDPTSSPTTADEEKMTTPSQEQYCDCCVGNIPCAKFWPPVGIFILAVIIAWIPCNNASVRLAERHWTNADNNFADIRSLAGQIELNAGCNGNAEIIETTNKAVGTAKEQHGVVAQMYGRTQQGGICHYIWPWYCAARSAGIAADKVHVIKNYIKSKVTDSERQEHGTEGGTDDLLNLRSRTEQSTGIDLEFIER